MLVQLTLENVLSFDAPATFSMVAGKITKQHVNHVTKACGLKILRGAIVYGANAGGKSNLVRAVALFREMLLRNDCSVCAGRQFRLNDPVKPAMRFAFDYTGGERLFHYEVATDGTKVLLETLSVREDDGEDEVLFDRTPESSGLEPRLENVEWFRNRTVKPSGLYLAKTVEDNLPGQRERLADATLLLSAYSELRELTPVFSFSGGSSIGDMLRYDNRFKSFLADLLRRADIGITDIGWEPVPERETDRLFERHWIPGFEPDGYPPENVSASIGVRVGKDWYLLTKGKTWRKAEELRLRHGRASFHFAEESEGTIRLIELASFLYGLERFGGTYFIDELDCHLHPFLAKHLLRTFLERPETKAQLVVTAHDTNLLSQELWRTDEVWFAEKRPKGSTDLYSVYQFAPRFDKDLEKGYLQGMYGAIPYFGKEPDRG